MLEYRELKLSSINNHFSLRADAKYRLYWGINKGMLYPEAVCNVSSLKHSVVNMNSKKAKKGELDSEIELIELEDVEKQTGVILSSSIVDELQSDKLLFGTADLLTTRLRPYLGKTILNDSTRNLAGTTEWIPFKFNEKLLHPVLAKYFLLSSNYVNHAGRLLSGKEHPRVSESDILALQVPYLPEDIQNDLVVKIISIEKEMNIIRNGIRNATDIINSVICKEFMFPLEEYKERAREKHFNKKIKDMENGFSLRNSVKYHHPDFEITHKFFSTVENERLKTYLQIPIRLGITAQKEDFVEDGDAYYVHPGAIKSQDIIDIDSCHQVSNDFFEQNKRRYQLTKGDLVLNRAGEGTIGKVGLFMNEEDPAIFSDFTMRIRLNNSIDTMFAWYFLKSTLFQSQLEREKRGMGNMTNIFPSQVERMHIISCDITRQETIASSISKEISASEESKNQLVAKRLEIDNLIISAVTKSFHSSEEVSV